MYPVICRTCANHVLVQKNSLAHTVVQWGDASRCAEFALLDGLEARATSPICHELRASIEEAVATGDIEIGVPAD